MIEFSFYLKGQKVNLVILVKTGHL